MTSPTADELALAWVRHGEYEQPDGVPSAHLPHPLTSQGVEQARATADTLLDWAQARGLTLVPCVDCSSLLRAWQTARAIVERWGERAPGPALGLAEPARVRSFDALCERSLGAAANLSVAQIEAILAADPRGLAVAPGWKGRLDARLPVVGAESIRDAGRRIVGHLVARSQAWLDAGLAGRLAVVVAHGAGLRAAAVELGLLSPDRFEQVSLRHGQAVFVAVDRAGRWRWLDGAWKARASGSTGGD